MDNMSLYDGQWIKLRQIGSDKIQQGVVCGNSPESQYIEVLSVIPFRVDINKALEEFYQIIL